MDIEYYNNQEAIYFISQYVFWQENENKIICMIARRRDYDFSDMKNNDYEDISYER
jgi:hypothetical protein